MNSIGQALHVGRRLSSRARSTVLAGRQRSPPLRRDLRTAPRGWSNRTGDSPNTNGRRWYSETSSADAASSLKYGDTLGAEAVRRWNGGSGAGGAGAGTRGVGGRVGAPGRKAQTPFHPAPSSGASKRNQNEGGDLLRRHRSPPGVGGSTGRRRESEDGNDFRSGGRRGELGSARHAGRAPRAESSRSNEGLVVARATTRNTTAPALVAAATSPRLEGQASIMRRLKQAKVRRDGEEAKRVLEDALARDDAAEVVDVFVFSAAVGVFAKAGQWEAALEVLGIMRERGVRPNGFTYNQAISACGNGGAWNWAVYLLKAMPKVGVPPDVVSYNAAIGACARAGQFEVAVVLLREMSDVEQRLAPNALTYNTVLSALVPATSGSSAASAAAAGAHWKRAVGLLEEMQGKQIALGAASYAPAVAACVAGDQAGVAVKLLRQMRREDKITPDLEAYNAAMMACRKAGEWELAVVLLEEVKGADGVSADSATYAEAIEACRKGGQSELAADLSKELQEAREARVVGDPTGWIPRVSLQP